MKLAVATSDEPWSLPDELCPDVYFTSGYGDAAAYTRNGRWESVLVRNGASCQVRGAPTTYAGVPVGVGSDGWPVTSPANCHVRLRYPAALSADICPSAPSAASPRLMDLTRGVVGHPGLAGGPHQISRMCPSLALM